MRMDTASPSSCGHAYDLGWLQPFEYLASRFGCGLEYGSRRRKRRACGAVHSGWLQPFSIPATAAAADLVDLRSETSASGPAASAATWWGGRTAYV
jgi:hypothetical protein